MLAAKCLHARGHLRVVRVGELGEQVVLDLKVDPGAEQPTEGPRREVHGGGRLQEHIIRLRQPLVDRHRLLRKVRRPERREHRVAQQHHPRQVEQQHLARRQERHRQGPEHRHVRQEQPEVDEVPQLAARRSQLAVQEHGPLPLRVQPVQRQREREDQPLPAKQQPLPPAGPRVLVLREREHRRQVDVVVEPDHVRHRVVHHQVLVVPVVGRHHQQEREARVDQRLVGRPPAEDRVVRGRVRVGRDPEAAERRRQRPRAGQPPACGPLRRREVERRPAEVHRHVKPELRHLARGVGGAIEGVQLLAERAIVCAEHTSGFASLEVRVRSDADASDPPCRG